jgi:hypothetical protein
MTSVVKLWPLFSVDSYCSARGLSDDRNRIDDAISAIIMLFSAASRFLCCLITLHRVYASIPFSFSCAFCAWRGFVVSLSVDFCCCVVARKVPVWRAFTWVNSVMVCLLRKVRWPRILITILIYCEMPNRTSLYFQSRNKSYHNQVMWFENIHNLRPHFCLGCLVIS